MANQSSKQICPGSQLVALQGLFACLSRQASVSLISCSGGNLAAIISHKAALCEPPVPLTFQVLVVPVTDNTASVSGPYASWQENRNTPALTPEKMLWFKNNYSPNPEDWKKWDSSPIFAPEESFKKVPDAWVGVAELDILRDEGLAYAEKIRKAGHNVEVKIYKGSPHPIMAMDGKRSCSDVKSSHLTEKHRFISSIG